MIDLQNLKQVRSTANIDAPYAQLSAREMEVLQLAALGQMSKEIADALYLSKRTVDYHLGNVFYKLGVSNRIRAVSAARRLGILPASEPVQNEMD